MVMLPAAEATVWHTLASSCVNGTATWGRNLI